MAEGNIQQTWNNIGTDSNNVTYCKMPDGTLINYGIAQISVNGNSRNSVSITYPMPYPTNIVSPVANATLNGVVTPPGGLRIADISIDHGYNQITIYITNTTTTQITSGVSWMVIGRWK